MKTQKENVIYILLQFFFWVNFPALLGFVSNYLLDAGYKSTHIGFIIAIFGAFSALLQPILASYADLPSSPSLKKIILLLLSVLLAFACILIFSHHKSLILTGLFFGLSIMMLQMVTPLLNSLGMQTINQGGTINFGLARGLGSLAYGITSFILGRCVDTIGTLAIPLSTVIGFAGMFILLLFFPFKKVAAETASATEKRTKKETSGQGLTYFFKRYRRFCIVLIGCVFVYMSHTLNGSFLYQIVVFKGGTNSEMGTAISVAAIAELPIMFGFLYIVKKIRCDILFRITGIFFFAKTLIFYLVPGMPALYFAQALQMGGWGLLAVASVYYVNMLMEDQDAIKGQAYMTMTYTLSTVTSSIFGGYLIDTAGTDVMLLFAAICAGIGMLLIFFATERIS